MPADHRLARIANSDEQETIGLTSIQRHPCRGYLSAVIADARTSPCKRNCSCPVALPSEEEVISGLNVRGKPRVWL